MNKKELLSLIETERDEFALLLLQLDANTASERNRCGRWSRKDILAHIVEWELWLIDWLEPIHRGESPAYVHDDAEVDQMNDLFVEKNKERSWESLLPLHHQAIGGILRQVEATPEPTLVDSSLTSWGNGRPVSDLVVAITANHFKEHANQLSL